MATSADAVDPAARADADAAGLRYVSDADPGISRRRAGRGFSYRLPDGTLLRDRGEIDRIRALAIPPAYSEVWICVDPGGHLQATGRDARRRKQYRYHPHWQRQRGEGRFERLPAFARALPRLRRRLRADLARDGLPLAKVQALVVALMMETLVRVGNDVYARSNRSYGLTTLRSRHVAFGRGHTARLTFRGKGGLTHEIGIDDPRLVRLVRACQELPGQVLFQYHDVDGALRALDSSDVNAYLRQAMDGDFTAKDFRTWGGTLHAFRALAAAPPPTTDNGAAPSARALAMVRNAVVREVAGRLRNTAAVCRRSYIDPVVFSGWEDGSLARAAARARGPRQWEQAAARYLARAHRAAAGPADGYSQRRTRRQ